MIVYNNLNLKYINLLNLIVFLREHYNCYIRQILPE